MIDVTKSPPSETSWRGASFGLDGRFRLELRLPDDAYHKICGADVTLVDLGSS